MILTFKIKTQVVKKNNQTIKQLDFSDRRELCLLFFLKDITRVGSIITSLVLDVWFYWYMYHVYDSFLLLRYRRII